MFKQLPFLASPNFNQRPAPQAVDLIVLHAISLPDGQFHPEHIQSLFLNTLNCQLHPSFHALAPMKVSAHFVVARDGGITQFVATNQRAWHAGESAWLGRENCNDFAIGIEMIGDQRKPFTKRQYQQTARLCKSLMAIYPLISPARIVGHQDIAPSRKWDPGQQWDWRRFSSYLEKSRGLRATLLLEAD